MHLADVGREARLVVHGDELGGAAELGEGDDGGH